MAYSLPTAGLSGGAVAPKGSSLSATLAARAQAGALAAGQANFARASNPQATAAADAAANAKYSASIVAAGGLVAPGAQAAQNEKAQTAQPLGDIGGLFGNPTQAQLNAAGAQVFGTKTVTPNDALNAIGDVPVIGGPVKAIVGWEWQQGGETSGPSSVPPNLPPTITTIHQAPGTVGYSTTSHVSSPTVPTNDTGAFQDQGGPVGAFPYPIPFLYGVPWKTLLWHAILVGAVGYGLYVLVAE